MAPRVTQQREIVSFYCKNKKCSMPKSQSMKFEDDRNRLCSFCRWEMEKKLAKLQGREPKILP